MNIVCDALLYEYGLDYPKTGKKQPWKYSFCFCGSGQDNAVGRFRADNRKGVEECLWWLDELEAEHVVLMNEFSQLLWSTDDGIVEDMKMPKYLKEMLEGWRNDS